MKYLDLIKVVFSLGIPSVLRLIQYRLLLKTGLHPVIKLAADVPEGDFFRTYEVQNTGLLTTPVDWTKQFHYFSYHTEPNNTGRPPNWHRNFINDQMSSYQERPWWDISDFDTELGDIKTVWELSRFDWLVTMAQLAYQGQADATDTMNTWLSDWCKSNQAYRGVNWKCGQEASIRVIHLALAALILKQVEKPGPALVKLLEIHLQRIYPTMSYAIAQNNNHGTSEAAALFIGGSWLEKVGVPGAGEWMVTGRKYLEERAQKLIAHDGSFSQYSVNYHRLMLDSYSMAERWRRELGLVDFSNNLKANMTRATNWLFQLTQPGNGFTPNLGANDGAMLLPLGQSQYSDYRASVQLAAVLFSGKCAYTQAGPYNDTLQWLDLDCHNKAGFSQASSQFDGGGYFVLHKPRAMALLRYPRFEFRPGQADALHVDFWLDGQNILRDAGTYSYNAPAETMAYFSDVEGHNTVQFDDRNQMPRLGRFLLGRWLKTSRLAPLHSESEQDACGAGYTDSHGASHYRQIVLNNSTLEVEDHISGFQDKAVLRWRLQPGDWQIEGQSVHNEQLKIMINASMNIKRFELIQGEESLYYLAKSPTPVLEIEVDKPGKLTTLCMYA